MQRYRGHFYNWYDTRNLAPLAPAYISTVDSGNLAGYLITLRAGLLEAVERDADYRAGPARRRQRSGRPVRRGSRTGDGRKPRLGRREPRHEARAGQRPGPDRRTAGNARRMEEAAAAGARTTVRPRRAAARLEEPLLATPEPAPADHVDGRRLLAGSCRCYRRRRASGSRPAGPAGSTRCGSARGGADLAGPVAEPGGSWWRGANASAAATSPAISAPRSNTPGRNAADLVDRASRLGDLADDLVDDTEFEFLFDPVRRLFSIGFNVPDGRLDASLLRHAGVGSAAGELRRHRHRPDFTRTLVQARTIADARRQPARPAVVERVDVRVLHAAAGDGVVSRHAARRNLPSPSVKRQINTARCAASPWGISESAYNAQDLDGNYQYRAFGVPGLGLKRGLADDLVIAPYASMLAAPLEPEAVVANLARLRAEGMAGRYGYYEAIDYTAERLPPNTTARRRAPTYMAHHQGMILRRARTMR